MKCAVIYFSQTGNTEKIAQAIREGVKQIAGNCEIIPFMEANPRQLYKYDLIGLGSPIFSFVEPLNVKLFVNNLRNVCGKHFFVFSTHGAHGEPFVSSMYQKLKARGVTIIGMRDWYASVYTCQIPKPYHTDGHPDQIDLKDAEEYGQDMVGRSRRISAGETGLIPPEPAFVTPWVKIGDRDMSKKEQRFESMVQFHKEKCHFPECSLCIDNCPMDGIDLTVDPPVIAKPCENCMFCVKICPTGAIDGTIYSDWAAPRLTKDLWTFLNTSLPQAESEGRFRRLVTPEKVGTGQPIYKTCKHPYWIIGKGLNL